MLTNGLISSIYKCGVGVGEGWCPFPNGQLTWKPEVPVMTSTHYLIRYKYATPMEDIV